MEISRNKKPEYSSPNCKETVIAMQGILCQSGGGIEDGNVVEYPGM